MATQEFNYIRRRPELIEMRANQTADGVTLATPPSPRFQLQAAYADWLRTIPWQWFFTLTFPWDVRSETARKKFIKFWIDVSHRTDLVERDYRTGMGCFAVLESDFGLGISNHFHGCFVSDKVIQEDLIRRAWLEQVRRGKDEAGSLLEQESVRLAPYDPKRRGVEYSLKVINDSGSDFLTFGLSAFDPAVALRPFNWRLRAAKSAAERVRATMGNNKQALIDEAVKRDAARAARRRSNITPTTRYLCPRCGLQAVAEVLSDTQFLLACGHRREELLPTNGISIEDIGHPLGDKHFPISKRILRNR